MHSALASWLLLLTISLVAAVANDALAPGEQVHIRTFLNLAPTNILIALLGVDLGSKHMSVQSSQRYSVQSSR